MNWSCVKYKNERNNKKKATIYNQSLDLETDQRWWNKTNNSIKKAKRKIFN